MKSILSFKEITKDDTALAGGKGASLGEMTQAGIPVPPGLVLLSDTFEQFLEETDLIAEIDTILHSVHKEEMHTVEHASEKIQQLILDAQMPADIAAEIEKHFAELHTPYVAVRSSATAEDSSTAAWAGQLDSYLNTTAETLLHNVQRCWASLFTPRAIFYRFEKDLHTTKISVAVVIQKMVESEVSGIAFSVHPVTEDRNQLIIEAGYGLGEAIVSGQITPDSYVVEKEPRRIIDINVNTQKRSLHRASNGGNEWRDIPEPHASAQVLTKEQILELTELIVRIENHYGFPCDIEWAYEKGMFYIVQSRPITTLSIESPTNDIRNVDWELWIRRQDQPPFLVSLWMNLEGPFMAERIGGGFTKQLCLRYGEDNLWIRSSSDLKNLADGIKSFLNTQSAASVEELFTKAKAASADVPRFIAETNALSENELLSDLESIISHILEIVFYTTSMPYFLLDVIEKNESAEIPHSEQIRKGAEELRAMSFYGQLKKEVLDRIAGVLASKYGIDTQLVLSLTIEEIRATLKKDVLAVSPEELALRENCAYWNIGDGKIVFSTDAKLMESIRNKVIQVPEDVVHTKSVWGAVAFAGKVRGTARIVITESEMAKVQKGDILVAPTTNPTLMSAILVCGAIVTDEGGIASHAAIVSRELKKPCIVGTKYATHIIKDGDSVEVDAYNGVVKILDKAAVSMPIRVDEWEFEFQQRNEHPILMADFWCRALYKKYVTEINLPVKPYDYFFTDSSKGYVKSAHKKVTLEALKKALDEGDAYPEYLHNQTVKRVNELGVVAKSILKELKSEISNKKLVELWMKFDESFATLIPWYWIPYYPIESNLLSDKVKDGLEKYKNEIEKITDFNNAFILSVSATEETAFQEEQKDFFGLVKIVIEDKDFSESDIFKKEAEKYLQKYSWMNTFILLPIAPLSLAELIEKIEKAIKEKSIETYHIQEQKKIENNEILKKILEIIKKDKELLSIIENTKKIGWVLTWSVETSLHTLSDLQQFFRLIAKHMKIPYSHWIYFTSDEIVEVLSSKKNLNEIKLEEREKGYFFLMQKGVQELIIGEEGRAISEWIDENLNKVEENITEFRGQPASPGLVKGKVRIALLAKDSHNLIDGEILVCAMTSPDYVPAMKRASAIITDEGGLLCHAAIMSREFGKLCIIATKIATRALKNGDFVEVDANNGVVKILDKAGSSPAPLLQ